jgi:transposase
MNYFLGIDIAKTNHVASLIDKEGNIVIRAIKFTNSNEGFKKLLTTIQDKLDDLSNIDVAMEATGHYWLALYFALVDNNFNVSVIILIKSNLIVVLIIIESKRMILLTLLLLLTF